MTNRMKIFILSVLLLVFLGVVGFLISNLAQHPSQLGEENEATFSPTISASTVEDTKVTKLRAIVKNLTTKDNESVLYDASSPQHQALVWTALVDEVSAKSISWDDDASRLITRYALAVLYFATSGNTWLDDYCFLSPKHECDWTSSSVIGGVTCNSTTMDVISLNFGTFLWISV